MDDEAVAGSGYLAHGRKAMAVQPGSDLRRFAGEVAEAIPAPESVYVMDVCETHGMLRLLELNPFGGADLYACDGLAIVASITKSIAGHSR